MSTKYVYKQCWQYVWIICVTNCTLPPHPCKPVMYVCAEVIIHPPNVVYEIHGLLMPNVALLGY